MNRKRNKLLTLLLALLAATALTCAALAASAPERAVVRFGDRADPAALTGALEAMEDVEVLWQYESLFSGAAVEAPAAALEAIEALEGVEGVGLVRTYALPQSAESASNAGSLPDGGLALMGLEEMWERGYDGDGMVIAVLDSGLRVTHDAFADYGLSQSPALSRADIQAFADKGGTKGAYISSRIPFAFDYYSRDTDVSTTDGHGTHVAALAAGYVPEGQGRSAFRGAAPAAQILSMKVFPDGTVGGADDAVILRALEDAWNLGADVVNLSLGTSNGFSQDDILDGLYCQAFTQMRQAGVILCAAAGNSGSAVDEKTAGEKLPTGSYTDYGTLCYPASYLDTLAIGAAEWSGAVGGRASVSRYSAWGTTSDLRLTPALTAFGGPTLSAGSKADNFFYTDNGTSMASGSAAGSFAVLLQALRERGVSGMTEAADLAESLMKSTAQVLTDPDGVPFSPRKQGAGLLNPSAAAESDLTITKPLLELGDSAQGQFTASFTLRNLSDQELTVQLEARLTTDAYEERNGVPYSLMIPRDITGGVAVTGLDPVTVPAHGERTVTVELAVSEALRRELAPVFPNGFFVEGYITAGAGADRSVHASLLGYCGDWGAAPILEPVDFRDVEDALHQLSRKDPATGRTPLEDGRSYRDLLAINMEANLPSIGVPGDQAGTYLLGENRWSRGEHSDAYNDLPASGAQAMYSAGHGLFIDLYTLRNAAHLVMLISNPATGEIYQAVDSPWTVKSAFNGYENRMGYAAIYRWEGTDAGGQPLPAGTQVRVDFYAWLDWDREMQAAYSQNSPDLSDPGSYRWILDSAYAPYREWSFPVTIDGGAPTVSAAGSPESLTVTFQDDLHLAYAAVWDDSGRLLAEKTPAPQAAGESTALTVNAAGSKTIYVAAADYASHTVGYAVDPANPAAGLRECPAAMLTDTSKGAWYTDAVNYVWTEGLMAGESPLTFQPQKSATRAQVVSALYLAAGSPAPVLNAQDLPFTDIRGDDGYLTALRWAYGQGIVDGYDGTTFAGGANVTRQQLAAMLRRCAQLTGPADPAGDLSGYADRSDVADWAAEDLSWAVGEGLITGRTGNTLDPKGLLTRAELAQIIMRFTQR